MRDQMTPEDVTKRLAAGEDALELSIEHWEINVERWSDESVDIFADCWGHRDDGSDSGYGLSASTCGLCVKANHWCEEGPCLYLAHYGDRCYDLHYGAVSSLIPEVPGEIDREPVVQAAIEMRDALIALREKQ